MLDSRLPPGMPQPDELVGALDLSSSALQLWHKRLGHLAPGSVQLLERKGLVSGLIGVLKEDASCAVCHTCAEANLVRCSFKKPNTEIATTARLQLVHSDVCTMRQQSFGGFIYFVTFKDDFSRKSWVFGLRHKSEVFGIFL